MAITKEQKNEYTLKYGKDKEDTGNTEVQIAILTQRIQELTEHLKVNTKDHHTRLGLMKLVGKRKRLLRYIERTNIGSYRSLIKELGIRK
ncbi:MAG TPA: 30S ribosomal protein S15 [Anaerolineae bacterium]|nr:30S ribosomal protein S15 [Anaerolineae bacterium]